MQKATLVMLIVVLLAVVVFASSLDNESFAA